jgi:AhpD family alkylhydroperoxidase
MSLLGEYVEDGAAPRAVQSVCDDIKETRSVDWVNNFWKAIANDPATLVRTWGAVKEVMAPGALDPLTKELIYLAVSITNGCKYCNVSHTAGARRAGMTAEMRRELIAVVGLANETNRLANAYWVDPDALVARSPPRWARSTST